MLSTQSKPKKKKALSHPEGGEPTWEIAYFFPPQGEWTEDDFFYFEESHCRRVELVNGFLEFLPMPTQSHQLILAYLYEMLKAFVGIHGLGLVLFTGMKIRVKNGIKPIFRDPDIVFMLAANAQRRLERYWIGADLVMEIVSGDPKDQKRDLVDKIKDYAAAGIAEYWIIEPKKRFIRVLTLKGKKYRAHGEFRPGDQATSVLLPGFSVAAAEVFAAGKPNSNRGGK